RCADDRILDLVGCHGCCRSVIREISTGALLWYHDLLRDHFPAQYFRCLWSGGLSVDQIRREMGHDLGGRARLAIVALAYIRFAALRNASIFRPWHHVVDPWKWIRSSAPSKIFGPPRRTRIEDGEQVGTSNGGQRPSLNSSFHP